MNVIMPLLVGVLFSAAIFLMLRPQLMRVALGVILLTNATNLFLFSSGRVLRHGPPIIPYDLKYISVNAANPVSQALILTAIVIGFALLSFLIAFVYRCLDEFGTQDNRAIGNSRDEEGVE